MASGTKMFSDRWNRYNRWHRSPNTIRARTRGGDTSLQKEKEVVSRMKQPHHCQANAYHDYYLHQAGRGYPRVRWNTLSRRTWTRKYFRKSVQIGRSFIKERSQNFGSRSFENRSEPSIGRHGRTESYTSSQIQIEINGTNLTPESHYRSGTSRWTSCKVEKAQTSSDEATEHIERHLRLQMALVHQNSCEYTKSELDLFGVPPTQTSVEHGYWESKGLTSALTDQGPFVRICSQWSWRGLHRPVQHLLVCGSTDREYRWFYLRPRYGRWTRQFVDAFTVQWRQR